LTLLRRISIGVSVLAVGVGGGWMVSRAQAPGPAPHPEVKVLLENDRVRMREIVLPPGSSTGQHTHQFPELAYVFTDGRLRVSTPGAEPVTEQWHAGEGRWREAGVTHDIAKAGDQPMRVLVIDVKTLR
jgi:quercetin dioxygenase-like cupin family protein